MGFGNFEIQPLLKAFLFTFFEIELANNWASLDMKSGFARCSRFPKKQDDPSSPSAKRGDTKSYSKLIYQYLRSIGSI